MSRVRNQLYDSPILKSLMIKDIPSLHIERLYLKIGIYTLSSSVNRNVFSMSGIY